MADIKVDEIEYFHFLGMVKELINELNEQNLSAATKQRMEAITKYIDDKEMIRGLAKERNLYYSSYIDKKDENPQMAAALYKVYLEKKEQIDKLNKKNNLVNNMIKKMEAQNEK